MKGTRAIKRVTCPVVNVSAEAKADSTEVLPSFECGTRVLSVSEQEDVYAKALERTKRLGGEEREDSALYNLSLQLYTIAASYVDPDSDPAHPVLYFGDTVEKSAENILKSELLSRDSMAFLAECHEVWQDMCNPQRSPKREEMHQYIQEVANDASAFLRMQPAARLTFAHSLCVLALSLQTDKLPDSSPYEAPTIKPPNGKAKPNRKVSKRARKR
jgi:hypothetical protein